MMSVEPSGGARLRIDGLVEHARDFEVDELAAMPAGAHVRVAAEGASKRVGEGVELAALLDLVRPRPEATHLTLHADHDDFHVSVPLVEVRGQGVVAYERDGVRLDRATGGPIRFLIRDPSACHTGELDECANVKYLSRLELTARKGRDTRPLDDAAHAALHAQDHA